LCIAGAELPGPRLLENDGQLLAAHGRQLRVAVRQVLLLYRRQQNKFSC
jgi:hypothetical protein